MACVAFRIDASRQFGSGHFWRCLSLAEALQDKNIGIVFISRFFPEEFESVLINRKIDLLRIGNGTLMDYIKSADLPGKMRIIQESDATQTTNMLSTQGYSPDWIVVDHYSLGAHWEKKVGKYGYKILAIDDVHNRKHHCDVLLDQNTIAGGEKLYKNLVPKHCDLLLGPKYSLLRREFRENRILKRPNKKKKERLLVSFGGSDAPNNTLKTLRTLKNVIGKDIATGNIIVDVVIGGLNPKKKNVIEYCTKNAIYHYLQVKDMARIMARADLAIGTGGIELWERCSMGLPSLVFESAENQKEQIRQAVMAGLVFTPNPGISIEDSIKIYLPALLGNSQLSSMLRKNCQAGIDPYGVDRVLNRIGVGQVSLRKIQESDSNLIFKWRNSRLVRKNSINSEIIDINDHHTWLKQIIKSKKSILLLGIYENSPIGVIRYEIGGEAATVSIFLDPKKINQGFGKRLLASGDAWLAENIPGINKIHADILPENSRSKKLFEDQGYATKLYKLEKNI